MPWLTSFERRSASSRADAGVQGLPSFPMVHRLVFAQRPTRRYWKMNDFAPEGVTFSQKPSNSSSQRKAPLGTGRIASTYGLVTFTGARTARSSNPLAITITGMSSNDNKKQGA